MQSPMILDKISQLIDSEEELVQAATKLNKHFRDIEAVLQTHASTSASIPLKNLDPASEPCVVLAFRKAKHTKLKRALIIVKSLAPDHEEVVPITAAPLRYRVEAATLLPQLIDTLAKKADTIAKSAQKAVDVLVNLKQQVE